MSRKRLRDEDALRQKLILQIHDRQLGIPSQGETVSNW